MLCFVPILWVHDRVRWGFNYRSLVSRMENTFKAMAARPSSLKTMQTKDVPEVLEMAVKCDDEAMTVDELIDLQVRIFGSRLAHPVGSIQWVTARTQGEKTWKGDKYVKKKRHDSLRGLTGEF